MKLTVDPRPTVPTLLGQLRINGSGPDLDLNRRRLLKLAVSSIIGAPLPGRLLHAQSAPQSCTSPIPQNHAPSNGGSCPLPNSLARQER